MLYDVTLPQFVKMLHNMLAILAKAAAHIEAKKISEETLLHARLSLDQFPLVRQLQAVCDTAKLGASRLTGKEAPVHEDTEKTLAEITARIQSVITYLGTYSAKDFEGSADRRITQPRWNGKTLSGSEFALQHVIPNFYFHFTTAYSILRHNGIDVGKRDYLGTMPYREPAPNL